VDGSSAGPSLSISGTPSVERPHDDVSDLLRCRRGPLTEGVDGAPAEDLAEMSSLWEAGISESEILQVE